MPHPGPARRVGLVRGAAALLAFLALSEDAAAGNILRTPPGADPRAAPVVQPAQSPDAAAAARAAASPLRRAMDAIRAAQAAQAAARAAAMGAASSVPDGLAPGGLSVANGGTWLDANAPTQSTSGGRTEVDVVQTGRRAVLTWETFNVGRETDLVFDQKAGGPDASGWVALNRVLDPAGRPSTILGSIRADGQVYVLNRNGILFGGSAQVDVGSLVVSGLELAGASEAASNLAFRNPDNPPFLGALRFERPSWGDPGQGDLAYRVVVEPGATIQVGARGRVVMLGGSVENGGTLSAPDGQIYLAAGKTIQFLAPSSAGLSDVRGLVGPPDGADVLSGATLPAYAFPITTPLVEPDGAVVNTGVLSARRGNITMFGADTRQMGLATATTGAEAAGSISIGHVGFSTTLGPGSVTQILPDLEETERLVGAGETYRPSQIRILGERIRILDDATVYAPAGQITVRAYTMIPQPDVAPDDPELPTKLDPTRIDVASGATLDVSGLRDVEVAMERNSIRAELRANELRDDPVLRVSPLRSRTVYFDGRLGAKLVDGTGVADLSGYYDLVERPVSERMTTGGSIALAANQLLLRDGSTVDVSGGSVRYLDGWVQRTSLVDPTGNRVPIESASPGVRYVGTDEDFVVSHERWGVTESFSGGLKRSAPRFERGYVEGGAAGTLTLDVVTPVWSDVQRTSASSDLPVNPSATAAVRVLDGTLRASTVVGPYQRELPSGTANPTRSWREQPAGGSLVIAGAGDLTIADAGPVLPPGFGLDDAVDPALYHQNLLPLSWASRSGLSRLSITSGFDSNDIPGSVPGSENRAAGGHLTVGAGVVVNLGDGGSFSWKGKAAAVDGTLLAPGGSVSLRANDRDGASGDTAFVLGPTGTIDVAGRFTNDALDGGNAPVRASKGGSVTITSASITLDAGSRIDVAGGARLDASGAKLTAGDAGSITLDTAAFPDPSVIPTGAVADGPLLGHLETDGVLDGHALGKGGSLTLRTGRGVVVGGPAGPDVVAIDPALFGRGGFASYTLQAERGLDVASAIAPDVETFLVRDPGRIATGARLSDVATVQHVVDPAGQGYGLPMSLTFTTGDRQYASVSPEVAVESGVSIRMAPGSTVALVSTDSVRVAGEISAPGGKVSLLASGVGGSRGVAIRGGGEILVPGYLSGAVDSAGRLVRGVQPGGSIVIGRDTGGVQGARSVTVESGAVLDASGVAGVIDLPILDDGPSGSRYRSLAVQGNAGSISVLAQSGLVAGELRLSAGTSTPAVARGQGGTLSVAADRMVVVGAGQGAAPDTADLRLAADAVDASGADTLALRSSTSFAAGGILFDGNVTLTAARSLSLESASLGTVSGQTGDLVRLGAPYVALLGGFANVPVAVGAASAGSQLSVGAERVDVLRTVALGPTGSSTSGGFESVRIDAGAGDIRLADHDLLGSDAGRETANPGLLASGSLTLRAGQVYVASRGHLPTLGSIERPDAHPGFLVNSPTGIVVERPAGDAPEVPLSFGERLTLRAPVIDQRGVIRAPAGQIRLEASDTLTLEPGSVTSISLVRSDGTASVVPFGAVGTEGLFFGYHQPGQAPGRAIRLKGPTVRIEAGSLVDASGGGDLQGFTFVAGDGGSSDVLAWTRDTKGNVVGATSLGSGLAAPFAIVPGLGSDTAPIGPVDALRDPRLKVGDQVWLQGVPGLPDGRYALLPAHYALLPGGLLVQPLGGATAEAPDTFVRPDGAIVAAGYRVSAGARQDPGFGRWAVMTRDVFGAYSDLSTPSFDAAALATASEAGVPVRTLADGGAASIQAGSELTLRGTGRFAGGAGGELGTLDVASPRIAVASAQAAALYPDHVVLDPQALGDFGAGSVMLGGTRSLSTSAPGTIVDATATEVVVDTRGVAWTGPEMILASEGSVRVVDGSVMRALGPASTDSSTLRLSGGGALLRLSTGDRVDVIRTGGSTGTLDLGNATLVAAGSMSLDAGGAVQLASSVDLFAPRVDVASSIVHLGDAPPGSTGTIIPATLITSLAASSDLVIRGSDRVVLHGALDLGNRAGVDLPDLTLDTPLVAGQDGASARIAAGALTLRNTGGVAYSGATTAGPGALALDVDALQLGPGPVSIVGFSGLDGRAGSVTVQGSGSLRVSGGIGTPAASFRTGRIGTVSGASYVLSASGDVALGQDDGAATLPAASSFGGRLVLSGSSVLLDTSVAMPAGAFQATATAGSLTLGPDAAIDVSGRAVDFYDVVRTAPGGAVHLAASADLALSSGSSVDVSGSDRGGAGGALELVAGGSADLQGSLSGSAHAGERGAAFSLDAGSVASFAAVQGSVESAGFTDARAFRLRDPGQVIRIEAGDAVSAHDVSLRSDAGQVVVAGRVGLAGDGSHAAGGRIELAGGAGVEVEATAVLDARAAAADADGFTPASGRVLVASTDGQVSVSGARIDVSGGRDGGGTIVLRAPRTPDGVAVSVTGDFAGASGKVMQGLATSETSVADAAWLAARLDESAAWLAAAQARNPGGIGGFELAPGILARSSGDLAIQGALSLARPDGSGSIVPGGPGWLGFAALGNLDVSGSVSDGFDGAGRSAALLAGRSYGIALEAGGSILLRRGGIVRTGTGDLALRAGGDVVFDDPTAATPAAVVYTAGQRTPWAPGFQNAGALGTPGDFPSGGGDVDLVAGGSILAAAPNQTTSAWLQRQGSTATWDGSADTATVQGQTSWSVVLPNFQQGVAALGGGDVRVRAGGDVDRLQVAIPTTGQVTTPPGSSPAPDDLVVRGGGDLVVSAGGDLLGGLYVLGRGHGELTVAGDVKEDPATLRLRSSWSDQATLVDRPVGTLIGVMDATVHVTAAGGARVEGAFDPMREGQVPSNLVAQQGVAFTGYSSRSAVDVAALGGPAAYLNDPWAAVDVSQADSTPAAYRVSMTGSAGLNDLFGHAPPTLRLISLASDASLESPLAVPRGVWLDPAPRGTAEILGGGNVVLRLDLREDNVEPQRIRDWRAPYTTVAQADGSIGADLGLIVQTDVRSHLGDPDPARIYALSGSVCAQSVTGTCIPQPAPRVAQFSDVRSLTFPKPLQVRAGRDVLMGNYDLQGNGPEDLSLLAAGRDVYEPVLTLFGEGTLVLQAGRDVVFDEPAVVSGTGVPPPLSGGTTISSGQGRPPNQVVRPGLPPDHGMDLVVMAGVKPGRVDVDGFTSAYLDPANAEQRAVHDYFPDLRAFMTGIDPANATLSEEALVAAFRALPGEKRLVFLSGVYFGELRDTGIDYNDPQSPRYQSFDRGFRAVGALFPVAPDSLPEDERGNVILHAKRVETDASASITLLAPYGRIEVGTDSTQPRVDYGQGGVVTRRGGAIRVMADRNVDLFTSRVFTLQGGDITMWTTHGSITAGSGSKTSVFQKPLSYLMTNDAVVQVDAFGLQTGAGIGVLDALDDAGDRPPSRLDLIAPNGEVNAGDAGIRVVGNLNLAARVVVGIENIQVTGAAQGVPKVEAPNLGALTTASAVASQAAREGVVPTPETRTVPDLPSIITVEVVGYEKDEGQSPAEKKKRKR